MTRELFARISILLITTLYPIIGCFGQSDIPTGTWRAHLAFRKIIDLAISDDIIYGASDMGLLAYDKTDQSFTTLSKVDGLSSSGITAIAHDPMLNKLMVAYEDGNLDIIHENTIINFSRLKDLNSVVGSKRINHISIRNSIGYLSTDYGIVVFDLNRNDLIETWRDLGRGAANLKISKTTFLNDSIFAGTEQGVIAGKLTDNLLNYENWIRYDTGIFDTTMKAIASFEGKVYAGVPGFGLYYIAENNVIATDLFVNTVIESMEAGSSALSVIGGGNLWMVSSDHELMQVADDQIVNPLTARQDSNQVLWIGDGSNGLVSNFEGTFNHYLPNGPSVAQAFGVRYTNQKLYAFNGGYTSAGVPLENAGLLDSFENGLWSNVSTTASDITDVETFSNKRYIASFGDGLLEQNNDEGSTLFDGTNSPLQTTPSNGTLVTDLLAGSAGLWVANFNAMPSLHLLKADGTWQSFSSQLTLARYPIAITEDLLGNIWMAVNPAHGGGVIVFDILNGTSIYLNETTGDGGMFNSKSVNTLALDRDGYVWAGTTGGVGYFYESQEDIVYPIFENRYLLKDETINDIAVDGANRKWMATNHGAWLFGPDGESLLHNFTEENSPLLDDAVLDIEINNDNGEVFFATSKGIISYRSDATAGKSDFSGIKIFPNPVTKNFSGSVAVSGLIADSFVKITDVSGKLIWEARAQGGTATWNLRDYNGTRARTGIYLVFAATSDGTESVVGKIAVID